MSVDKRLDDLEGSLSAEQILLRWLDETQKFSSRAEYLVWTARDLENRRPFRVFFRDLQPLAKSKFRDKSAEPLKILSRAEESLRFGFYLFQEMNEEIERQIERSFSSMGPLVSELERLEGEFIQPIAFMPLALSEETAAMVRTALEHYVMPMQDLARGLRRWVSDHYAETTGTGPLSSAEEKLAKVQEVGRALFTGGTPGVGWWVDLGAFPFRSLGTASLLEGKWIDIGLLKLAEFAALLVSRGFRLQNPPDSHPLETLLVVNSDGLPASEQELSAVLNEADGRLREFEGNRRQIRGRFYADIDQYRSWEDRAVTGELKRMPGIDVADWNRWLETLGGEGRAEIGGVKIRRLEAPFSPADFVVCEDDRELAVRNQMRRLVLEKFHGKIGSSAAPASRSQIREGVSSALISLLASRELAKRMEWLMFGHRVLFEESQEQLTRQISFWEAVATRFNEISSWSVDTQDLNESTSAESQIDLDSVRSEAVRKGELMFKSVQDVAEAYALKSLGRHRDAMKLFGELIAKHTPANTSDAQAPDQSKAPKSQGPSIWQQMLAYTEELERAYAATAKQEDDEE
jgi:hypothetical protein